MFRRVGVHSYTKFNNKKENGKMNNGTVAFRHYFVKDQLFWVVEIKCPIMVGVHVFSSAIDAYLFFTNEWYDLKQRGFTLSICNSLSADAFSIIFYYIQAAYCQQGYLASKIENHQVYITNGRQ